jgi:hypothetical protein
VHIEYRDVPAIFLFRSFLSFKNIFSGGGSICSHVSNRFFAIYEATFVKS